MNTLNPTKSDASNTLHSGKVSDFGEAMHLVVIQCEEQRYPEEAISVDATGRSLELAVNASLWRFARAALRCLAEYRAWPGSKHVLARVWMADEDDNVAMIAEALDTGDYSGLAV